MQVTDSQEKGRRCLPFCHGMCWLRWGFLIRAPGEQPADFSDRIVVSR